LLERAARAVGAPALILLGLIIGFSSYHRRVLLTRFGSLEKIRAASVEELLTIEGMTRAAARKIK